MNLFEKRYVLVINFNQKYSYVQKLCPFVLLPSFIG
jgi:hypothetical protein